MKLLAVIPDLHYGGAAKQLMLVVPALPRDRFETRVCVLGKKARWSHALEDAGVPVETLGWTRYLDARPLLRLRQMIREFQPDAIHVWGLAAFRAVVPVAASARLVVSKALRLGIRKPRLSAVDRWLLRRADGVAADDPLEAELYRRLGLGSTRLLLIPPGVESKAGTAWPRHSLKSALGLSENVRLVVCAGPLEARKGFRDAIWALDILKYVYDDLHLALIGDGPEREALERFARSIRVDDRVHYLGDQDNIPELLREADVVWVPSISSGGANVALEAMAAGRPVIASALPGLAQIVADGETGFIVNRADKVALARRTRVLLEDADQNRRFGNAGKERARRDYSAEALVRGYTDLFLAAVA